MSKEQVLNIKVQVIVLIIDDVNAENRENVFLSRKKGVVKD